MGLAGQWEEIEAGLAPDWGDARLLLKLEEAAQIERAAALLGPVQPIRTGTDRIGVRIARDGSGPNQETFCRALGRLDAERLHGILEVVAAQSRPAAAEGPPPPTLTESWDAALAGLPADWSDLLGEIELESSDWFERGALHMAPINPRRVGDRIAFRFRCASRFGYGASAGMVRRCLERCEAEGMRGHVAVLRALSDTRPVGTQGPVWQLDGETV
jgi:hypothetical protein